MTTLGATVVALGTCLFASLIGGSAKPIDIESPKIDCLSFVYVPATSAAHNRLLFCFYFAAAIYCTNEENTCH
jgi:hypothetical protein